MHRLRAAGFRRERHLPHHRLAHRRGVKARVALRVNPDVETDTHDYISTGKLAHKFGVDIGFTRGGILVWAVLAPTTSPAPGALAGSYGGVTASATAVVGAGANLLVGGTGNAISLQPLSIEGNTGLNVAAGVAALTLTYQPG